LIDVCFAAVICVLAVVDCQLLFEVISSVTDKPE